MKSDSEILVDLWSLSEPGGDRGLGRYTHEVFDATRIVSPGARGLSSEVGQSAFGRQLKLRREASGRLFHATTVYHLPLMSRPITICSILDTIPLDLRQYQRFGLKARFFYGLSKQSKVIVVPSGHTASRVEKLLGIPRERMVLAPVPVSRAFRGPTESRRGSGLVLALVDDRTSDPRKRSHWIEPVSKLLKAAGVDLHVVGRQVDSAKYPSAVVHVNPDDPALSALYSDAAAFFYPSGYEGQGMPPLEAMSRGVPVVAYANTSLSEVVGNGGVLLDDPAPWTNQDLNSPMTDEAAEKAAAALIKMTAANDLDFSRLRSRALEQAALYSHERFQTALRVAYEKAWQ